MALGIYQNPGDVIDYTPAGAVATDTLVLVGKILGQIVRGVTADEVTAGKKAALRIKGIVRVPKAAEVITAGATLYWDATASAVTTTSTDNTYCGHAELAAAEADTHVNLILDHAA